VGFLTANIQLGREEITKEIRAKLSGRGGCIELLSRPLNPRFYVFLFYSTCQKENPFVMLYIRFAVKYLDKEY